MKQCEKSGWVYIHDEAIQLALIIKIRKKDEVDVISGSDEMVHDVNEYDIFLIDYDSDTIIRIDDKIFSLNSKIPGVRNLSFIVTYIPNYLTVNKKYRSSDVNNLDISKYNKYSVGGLIKIIEGLELNNLIDEFKLNDPDYENILSYDAMLKNLSI